LAKLVEVTGVKGRLREVSLHKPRKIRLCKVRLVFQKPIFNLESFDQIKY
jgi:hypothetical protein